MPHQAASATLTADSPKRQARKRELPDDGRSPKQSPQQTKRPRAAQNPTPDDDVDPQAPPPPAQDGIVVDDSGGRQKGADEAAEPSPEPVIQAMTPSRRKPGRPRGSVNKNKAVTPSRLLAGTKWAAATPTLNRINGMDTPSRRNLADRSARRKVARTLIDRVVGDGVSDDDDDGTADAIIAREIYQSSDDDEPGPAAGAGDSTAAAGPTAAAVAAEDAAHTGETPTKRRPGRPRGSGRGGGRGGARGGRKRSPTPPRDLPAHELYLFQNKPGAVGKASSSNRLLSSTVELLTHEEYFSVMRNYTDPHADGVRLLRSIHAQSFRQWEFELEQGFTVCLYGYGSKRDLLRDFATELYRRAREEADDDEDDEDDDEPRPERAGSRIVMVNGHVRGGLKEALGTMARAVDPAHKLPATTAVAMAHSLEALLAANPGVVLTVILNSVDAPPLRKTGGTATTTTVNTGTGTGGVVAGTAQSILAQLAAHPQVRLACSADTPGFALLWDARARALLNLALHDCTTFAPFGPAELDVVDEVHELLGRRARRVGGKDGVVFVLRSLPENAKNLFRLLVTEALVAMDDGGGGGGFGGGGGGGGDGDGDIDMAGGAVEGPGVEYRIMYNKAAEEFICSSEMAFRTLLKEFHDHQIITSRKDPLGTELLCLPFRKDELESILEDLMS